MNTERKIQDYLHFYLGQQVLINSMGEDVVCDLITVSRDGGAFASGTTKRGQKLNAHGMLEGAKLLLRPLSDMTEEEAIELVKVREWKSYGPHPRERKYETYKNAFGQIVVQWGHEGDLRSKNVPQTKESFYPEELPFLLSRGFDLFNLIPDGLAINKTTLQP